MSRPRLSDALPSAELIHGQASLAAAIARMGKEIGAALAGKSAIFLTIMQGGLVFAGQLATAIDADLEFDYVHATRFRGTTEGGELQWMRRPDTPLAGRIVVLVDDILDEGHTLKAIRDWCHAEAASQVPGLSADFVGVEVPDRYVFGYGMDFHEQGRNLPGIYAL